MSGKIVRTLMTACCLVAVMASGKTCTWTGGGDGVLFSDGGNWDSGAPASGDTLVFRPQGSLFVAFSGSMSFGVSEIRFESGNTVLGFSPGVRKANIGLTASSAIYVAENATATISNRIAGVTSGVQTTISGGGEVTFYSDYVDNVGYFNLIDIQSGTTVAYMGGGGEGHHRWMAKLTRVRNGAVFKVSGSCPFNGRAANGHKCFSSVQVDGGGVLDLYYVSAAANGTGSIFGDGKIRVGGACTLSFVQDLGPTWFGGEIEYYKNGSLTVTFLADASVPPENLCYTLVAENAFAGVNVVDRGALRFAPGTETYRIGTWKGNGAGSELVVADTNGAPITLYTGIGEAGNFRASGSGSLMLTTGGTITGDVISIEGTLGLVAGAGAHYYFGDGLNAANDADLSSLHEIHMDTTSTGSATFQNVNPTCYEFPLTGSGMLNIVGNHHFRRFEYKAPTASFIVNVDGTLTAENPSGNSCTLVTFTAPDTTWNIFGGEWYRGFKMNSADSVSILPCRQGMAPRSSYGGKIVVSNAWCNFDRLSSADQAPDFTVINGATVVMNTPITPRQSATPENPTVLTFDGGTYLASFLGMTANSKHSSFGGSEVASNILVAVGASGMGLGTTDEGSELGRSLVIYTRIAPAAAPDGGITRKVGEGTVRFAAPVSLIGPFRSLDGTVEVAPVCYDIASNPSWLGAGDMYLRNSVIDITSLADGDEIRLASGVGCAFTYLNMSAIRFGIGDATAAQAKNATIGPLGSAAGTALVRGGKGAVMYLWDYKSFGSGLFDGTVSAVMVNGGVATNAAGTTKDPIIVYSSKDNRCHFATCDASGSIRTFTGYKDSFDVDASTSTDIVFLSASSSVPKNRNAYMGGLKLAGSSSHLTVSPGATLHLGNGIDPAIVLIDKAHLYGASGFVDFGESEGVFAGIAEGTVVQPVLKGTAGITFTAPPNLNNAGNRHVRVLGNNLHSGGTYVNSVRLSPENAGAFGFGDVYVGGGHNFGGRVHFNTAGLVFTNNFHVAGRGKIDTTSTDGSFGYGALVFTASTKLSGTVELMEETRVCCLNAGDTAEFSGMVSGDRVEVYNGAGTVAFMHANSYTGGTAIVAATLKLSGDGSLGTGDVLLDGGTLVIDKNTDFSLANRIHGKGTVRLEGGGAIDFAGGFELDGYGGLVSDNFTLALGKHRRFFISSLAGFSSVTTEGAAAVDLYVADGIEFFGSLPANVTLHADTYIPPGMVISFR